MFLLVVAIAVVVGTVPPPSEPPPPEPSSGVIDSLIGQDVIFEPDGGEEFAEEFVESGDLATLVETDNVFRKLAVMFTAGDYEAAEDLALEHATALPNFAQYEGQRSPMGRLSLMITLQCLASSLDLADYARFLQQPGLTATSALEVHVQNFTLAEDLPGDVTQCRIGIAVLDAIM